MQKYIVGLILGLVIGTYLTASYPGTVINNYHRLRIPLLAPVAYTPGH